MALLFAMLCAVAKFMLAGLSATMPLLVESPVMHMSQSFCDPHAARVDGSYKRLRITLPAGTSCAHVRLGTPGPAKRLNFFMSGTHFPYPFEPRPTSSFHYRIVDGDRLLLESSLQDSSMKWYSLAPETGRNIDIRIGREDARAEDTIEFWMFTTEAASE